MPLRSALSARPRRQRAVRATLVAMAALASVDPVLAEPAETTCPWIVQPAAHDEIVSSEPAYEIMFEGLGLNVDTFYGFSVTSIDLAWQLAEQSNLPDLTADARRLESLETRLGTFYRMAPDSIDPPTIYLVAARVPVDELEDIEARIEPSRTRAISHLAMRARGGSDQSGPLPHRSVPGVLIADASSEATPELQICAYQVAMR